MNEIKILIVDDQNNVRRSLGTILSLIDGFQVVGEAAEGNEAIRLAGQLAPDVVLMDMSMSGPSSPGPSSPGPSSPDLDGIEASRIIKRRKPGVGVVMLTMHGSKQSRQRAAENGVDAFVEKGITMEELSETIRRVHRNKEQTR